VGKMLPVLHLDIQVGGIENWLDRGIVLMPNHESNFDVIALIAINDFAKQQPLAFVAKEEL
jgi:1-acyl-sn-glycerol-3-phosphate acyltransferase